MNNGFRWAAALLTLVLVAAVGVFTYNLGVAHALAGQAPAIAAPGGAPAPYIYYYPHPWGWGFGYFPFFGLLWIFLLFGLVRRLWWGPRWYRRGWGPGYYDCVPPHFEEWHRRAHAEQQQGSTKV